MQAALCQMQLIYTPWLKPKHGTALAHSCFYSFWVSSTMMTWWCLRACLFPSRTPFTHTHKRSRCFWCLCLNARLYLGACKTGTSDSWLYCWTLDPLRENWSKASLKTLFTWASKDDSECLLCTFAPLKQLHLISQSFKHANLLQVRLSRFYGLKNKCVISQNGTVPTRENRSEAKSQTSSTFEKKKNTVKELPYLSFLISCAYFDTNCWTF